MKLINFFLLLLFLLIGVSCNLQDSLNISPRNELTEENFYTTEGQFRQALDELYRQLGLHWNAYGLPDTYGELASDNTKLTSVSGTEFPIGPEIVEWRPRTSNARIRQIWENNYHTIFLSNNIINRLKNTEVDINEELKTRMIAEAVTVRSIIYFNLVRVFGDVPLLTEVVSPEDSYNKLRDSSELIYNLIIDDLNFAKNNLPDQYFGNDVGRITRYAASGILAKVYMTLNEFNNAQNELEFIINSGRYSLVDNYADNFDYQINNNEESILEAQYKSGDPNAPNSNHQRVYKPFGLMPPGAPIEYNVSPGRGDGMNEPTADLISEYEKGDPRRDITIFLGFNDPVTNNWVNYTFFWKYFDPNFFTLGNNVPIIRYADILLMYAEITGEAEYLNKVRRRVGLPEWGSDDYPYDLYPTFELALEHERRVEFASEYQRTFDLVRTGRLKEILSEKGIANITDENILWPIPQNVIDVNPNITQNPGY